MLVAKQQVMAKRFNYACCQCSGFSIFIKFESKNPCFCYKWKYNFFL